MESWRKSSHRLSSFNSFPLLSLSPTALRRLLPLFLGGLFFVLAGCADSERLTSATEIDEPNYREGQALLKTGRKQEALGAFLKVISKRGDDAPESHLELGLLYLQHINDPLAAIYHFKKYLALRPNSQQAPLIKQRIDAATREFARTLPAQPIEGQPPRVDLVAALDRMKQENDGLKQELANLKSGRGNLVPETAGEIPARTATQVAEDSSVPAVKFSLETVPTVRTRPTAPAVARPLPTASKRGIPQAQASAAAPAISPVVTAAPPRPSTTGRRHIVRPGESLSKISMQYYGNRTRVRDIFAANRNVMKNESDLKVGMEIKLP